MNRRNWRATYVLGRFVVSGVNNQESVKTMVMSARRSAIHEIFIAVGGIVACTWRRQCRIEHRRLCLPAAEISSTRPWAVCVSGAEMPKSSSARRPERAKLNCPKRRARRAAGGARTCLPGSQRAKPASTVACNHRRRPCAAGERGNEAGGYSAAASRVVGREVCGQS